MDAKKAIDELNLLSFMLKSKGDEVYKAVDAGIAALREVKEMRESWEIYCKAHSRPTQAELEDLFQGVDPNEGKR